MSEELPYRERYRLIKLGLLPKETGPKPKKAIPKISEKKKKEMAEERQARGGEDTQLQKWFKDKIRMSSGVCSECGCRVETHVFKYAAMTVAHLLPKRDNMCPSVKTHPLNFIILCPDHHHQFDNCNWEEKEKMSCWPIVRDRLMAVYLDLHIDEHRHFPVSVLDYMEKHKPF